MNPSATIIVVSYNKRRYTELCLQSMLQCDPLPDQIVVVDNGSTDGSIAFLKDDFPEQCRARDTSYVLIANSENKGACTARNQALRHSNGDMIAFVDNDVAVRSRDWLAVLGTTLEQNQQVGIVGPKLLFPAPPHDIECAGVGISRNGRVQYMGRGQPNDTPEFAEPGMMQCLTSACWLMRRSMYEQIGELDEVFNPAQYEDFDYCYRAREAGWQVMYQPEAEMYHFENTTTDGSQSLNFRYITIKNGTVFKDRWRHMFSTEDGPDDEDCKWVSLEIKGIEQVGTPPII